MLAGLDAAKARRRRVRFRKTGDQLRQRGEMIGLPKVVAVEKGKPLGGRRLSAPVAGRPGTPVRLLNQMDPLSQQILDRCYAAIRGPVVDDDHFVMRMILR